MKQPFQIGDKVTCSFRPPHAREFEAFIMRRVSHVERVSEAHALGKASCTGWLVSADGGEPCPHCGLTAAPIPLIDSGYYAAV